jgi:predicted histone-like DNA-binding protein
MIDYSISVKSAKPGTKKANIEQVGTKAYGQGQIRKKLTLEEFASHIREHGCVYDKGDIAAIITKTIRCLREQLLLGNSIVLGDLGTFAPTLKTKGATLATDFSTANILAVNVKWTKSRVFKGTELRKDAEFNLVGTRSQQAETDKAIKNQETIQGME